MCAKVRCVGSCTCFTFAQPATFLHLKGKKNDGGKDYKLVLEDNFQSLEAEGITHPGMADIRKWLEREW